jgi:hypothetical protein
MPTQPQEKQPADRQRQEREELEASIANNVMRVVGQPGNLHRVQVRQLWGDHYRVNVFVGVDAACAKVAHSYFLVADGDGAIIASTPQITRRYELVTDRS